MAVKLDLKDKKLLALLDDDARMSNTQLAKKVGLSKPAIEYRLRRFEKEHIVFSYYTVIDFTKLGYQQYKLYLKLQDATLEDEEDILNYWKKQKSIVWVANVRGRWDVAVSILAKSNHEFGQHINKFMRSYAKFVLEKDVLLTEYSPQYAREYLPDAKAKEFTYGVPVQSYALDDIEVHLLAVLSTNARASIVELMEKTNLTRDIIAYRMKKLEKDKIIIQYRCYPRLERIGMVLHKVLLRTKNLDEQSEKSLKAYAFSHKKATQLLKLIGSWDIEIEFETQSEDELFEIIADIRKKYANIIRDYDILRVVETVHYTYFPF